jgi:hypothetical protein
MVCDDPAEEPRDEGKEEEQEKGPARKEDKNQRARPRFPEGVAINDSTVARALRLILEDDHEEEGDDEDE